MVVVSIIALMALLAVPALTKDRVDARFYKFVRSFVFDVRRGHMEAISSRDHRQFVVARDRYSISAIIGAKGAETPSLLTTRLAPPGVEIAGVAPQTAMPGTSYPAPTMPSSPRFRVLSTGGTQADVSATGTFTDSSFTVFFRTTDGAYKARVVIFQATCHTTMYKSW